MSPEELEKKLYKDAKKKLLEIADKWVIKCPECDELNSQNAERINLIECTKCSIHFCFQCGRVTPDLMKHFDVSNCYYKAFD